LFTITSRRDDQTAGLIGSGPGADPEGELKYGVTRFIDRIAEHYDLLIKLGGRTEGKFRCRCIELASLAGGEKALDVGCGTGSLSMALACAPVGVETFACDISPGMIDVARSNSKWAGLDIEYGVASIMDLPYPDDTFDVLFTNIMFHHLDEDEKRRAVMEVYRVLKPGGAYVSAEFGFEARGPVMRRILKGRWAMYPEHLVEAGFIVERESTERSIWLLPITFRVARKQGEGKPWKL